MFRSLIVALALLGPAAACNGILPGVQGSGVMASEQREVPAFERLELDGPADVVIEVGPGQSVRIEADDNIIPLMKTEVTDGALKISSKGSYSTRSPIKISVTVPRLLGVGLVGSGSVDARGIAADSFVVALEGSGSVKLAGRAEVLAASLDGSGSLLAAALAVTRGAVSLDGSGDIELQVSGQLAASVDGSGSVRYTGGAKDVTQSISGSGSVAPM